MTTTVCGRCNTKIDELFGHDCTNPEPVEPTEYPLVPERFQEDIVRLVEGVKKKIKTAIEDVLSEVYVDIAPWIEGDLQQNWREQVRSAMQYRAVRDIGLPNDIWAQNLRSTIFNEHRAELELGLIADLVRQRDEYKKMWLEAMNRS